MFCLHLEQGEAINNAQLLGIIKHFASQCFYLIAY